LASALSPLLQLTDSDYRLVSSNFLTGWTVGLVRDLDDAPIQKMTLEHYPGMSKKALQSIVDKARKHWSLGNITIIQSKSFSWITILFMAFIILPYSCYCLVFYN
jgi:hypothetical protein